jgi:transcriptional regulator with XRE-family HTH domain
MDSRGIGQKLEKKTLNKVLSKIAQNVKKHRIEKGFSQLNLAYAMGHESVGLIYFVEAGLNNRRYNIEHIATIAKILDIPICELFVGVDEILDKST